MIKFAVRFAAVALIAAGLAVAQGPGFGRWRAANMAGVQNMTDWQLDRLSQLLSLDAGQKQQAKTIFDGASAATQVLQPALAQAQTDLHNATRTGKDIDKLATALGTLLGRVHAIHATAMAQFYIILTPSQRDQFDKYQGAGMCAGVGCPGGMGMGMGMMHGLGPGARQ